MKKLEKFKKKKIFRGREGWRTLNKLIFVVLYSILLASVMIPPLALNIGWIFLGFIMILPSYYGYYEHHMKIVEIELKKEGIKAIGGWIEHEHGLGEKFKPVIKDIHPISRLSETNIKAVDDYIDFIIEQTEQIISVGVRDKEEAIEDKSPQKRLTYEEFKEMEDKEMEEYIKDYKKWKEEKQKQNKIEEKIETGEENGKKND